MHPFDYPQQSSSKWLDLVLERERLSWVGAFTQGLIHNINGPLQNISMLTELIRAGFEDLDRAPGRDGEKEIAERSQILDRERQRLQKLSEQISLLDRMLRDLRLLHEIERNPTEVDLNLLITSLVQAFRCDLFFKHQVQLELKLANDLPFVRVLARHLMPALVHLFQNAMTALRDAPQKHLAIVSRTEGKTIWISLRDSGCGLKPGEEDRCFEPFYSGWPPAIQKHEKHLGVGLFLASVLLEPYAIKLRLQTEREETVATLEIPVNGRG
jgi:signal transduction histidine kinase